MAVPTLSQLVGSVAQSRPADGAPPEALRHAAVAMLLREGAAGPEVLLMTRAEHEHDHWSGHVSLPGGRSDPGDESLLHTAVRETREEVGLDLAGAARLVGRLEREPAVGRGRRLPMEITPFVFERLCDEPLRLGHEAVEAFWFPLGAAASGALDDTFRYRHDGRDLLLPCWRHEGRTIWGLTHRMLTRLLQVAPR